ncbi:hypothetical protein Dsin_017009 [Dipteronia sinensis]|uniref:Biogenesis of lysosome-related organelles complex 1 subunit 2 n=1 Tax=Dipteronia sinensis TaxID=43782 RepID=A0AAE0E7H5_9ROSI|nr:hypothetical protein Dsin_017009 [Dipteronia sinensis]
MEEDVIVSLILQYNLEEEEEDEERKTATITQSGRVGSSRVGSLISSTTAKRHRFSETCCYIRRKRGLVLDLVMAGKERRDELAESVNDLLTSVSSMVKAELEGTNNTMELLEKMNLKVAEEYKGFGDLASGLRVFVEQLKSKSGCFDDYVQQIDAIENQVTHFEAVISMLDQYVSLLESKMHSLYQHPPT